MIKIATQHDLEKLANLVADFYAEENYSFDKPNIFKNLELLISSKEIGRVYLVIDDNQIVGYSILVNTFCLELGGKVAYIDELFIAKDKRGRKLATTLINEIISYCKMEGYATIRLEVERENPRASELYKRFGFICHDRNLMTLRI